MSHLHLLHLLREPFTANAHIEQLAKSPRLQIYELRVIRPADRPLRVGMSRRFIGDFPMAEQGRRRDNQGGARRSVRENELYYGHHQGPPDNSNQESRKARGESHKLWSVSEGRLLSLGGFHA
jgi:hypothetical protein